MQALSEQHIKDVRENFDFFDRDKNGEIDVKEFEELLKVLDPKTTEAQAIRGFELIDENSDGHIDFTEFLAWWETCWWEY